MNDYPSDWKLTAKRIKDAAEWRCERCRHEHDTKGGYMLTVHHLDGDKANCADWNLAALCQRCHLNIQSRVKMDQGILFPDLVAEWFWPHFSGYLEHLEAQKR